MTGKARRRKGHDFERWLVNRLKATGLFRAVKRGLQSNGAQVPDVSADELWIECKRQKRPNLTAALWQASDGARKGTLPAAVTRADRKPPLITMMLEDFLELLEARTT